MAKTKSSVAARKKSTKRGKASAKPARKKTAKKTTTRATAKPKAKSKVRRAAKSVTKPAAKKQRPKEVAVAEKSVGLEKSVETIETTIIAAVEAPTPTVVAVEEMIAVATSTPADREEGPHLAGDLEVDETPDKKVA
jgi:hypothetical protein